MSRATLAPFCLALLVLGSPLAAQEGDDSFALGIGLRNASFATEDAIFSALAPRFYFAFRAGESALIEPSFALFRFSQESENEFGSSSFTTSVVRVGAGILFLNDVSSDGRLYWGPRLGVSRIATDSDNDGAGTGSDRWDLSVALVTGGEYFLVPGFGLGGEIGLEYTRIGDEGGDTGEDTASILATLAELRLRWYLR